MKLLGKIVVFFLATIGALTIIVGVYLYLADPFGIKSLFKPTTSNINSNTETSSTYNPVNSLSPAQLEALNKLGIDPTAIPTDISPELEQCLINAIGKERSAQIKAGAIPTPMDLLKAKTCF